MIERTEHLTVELAAVWDEMFDAVSAILRAAERIDELANKMSTGAGRDISFAVAEIFQACAFQDITGQRIAKVAHELASSDQITLVEQLGLDEPINTCSDANLLNGPQIKGKALSQNAVDDLFGPRPQEA